MTEAVLATFADCKIIRTRSCIQIICEVPIEQADHALKMLGGIPQPGSERWIGLALAPKERKEAAKAATQYDQNTGEPVSGMVLAQDPPQRRPFASMPLSQKAGMRGHDEQFKDFLELNHLPYMAMGAEEAIRALCAVRSRSELDTNDIAAAKWRKLEEDFQAYKTDLAYAGSIK